MANHCLSIQGLQLQELKSKYFNFWCLYSFDFLPIEMYLKDKIDVTEMNTWEASFFRPAPDLTTFKRASDLFEENSS